MEIITNATTWVIIAICGAIGGLLFSAKDQEFRLPRLIRRTDKNNSRMYSYIYLGVVTDLLFGVVGGFVIFVILPSIPNREDLWGLIKIASLAVIGGYSGRVLVNRVASDQIRKTDEKVEILEKEFIAQQEQDKQGDQALRMLFQIIDGEEFKETEIENNFTGCPLRIIELGLGLIGEERKKGISYLLDNQYTISVEKKQKVKKGFEKFIPLLSVLIKMEKKISSDDTRRIDHHLAVLSYLYKDQLTPDWNAALKCLNESIKVHQILYSNEPIPPIYKFNKLLYLINLNKNDQASNVFDDLLNNDIKACDMIITAQEILAPTLHSWVLGNKRANVADYLSTNKNYNSEILDSWKIKPAK